MVIQRLFSMEEEERQEGRFRLFAPDASFTPHASPLLCAATRAHVSMPALPTRVSQHCGGAHQAEVVPGDGVHPLADFFVLVVDELQLPRQHLRVEDIHRHAARALLPELPRWRLPITLIEHPRRMVLLIPAPVKIGISHNPYIYTSLRGMRLKSASKSEASGKPQAGAVPTS